MQDRHLQIYYSAQSEVFFSLTSMGIKRKKSLNDKDFFFIAQTLYLIKYPITFQIRKLNSVTSTRIVSHEHPINDRYVWVK